MQSLIICVNTKFTASFRAGLGFFIVGRKSVFRQLRYPLTLVEYFAYQGCWCEWEHFVLFFISETGSIDSMAARPNNSVLNLLQ